jgi:hypothetical protein
MVSRVTSHFSSMQIASCYKGSVLEATTIAFFGNHQIPDTGKIDDFQLKHLQWILTVGLTRQRPFNAEAFCRQPTPCDGMHAVRCRRLRGTTRQKSSGRKSKTHFSHKVASSGDPQYCSVEQLCSTYEKNKKVSLL